MFLEGTYELSLDLVQIISSCMVEIIGWSTLENPEKQTKRKPKVIAQRDENAEPTMLDQFVKKSGGSGETQEEASQVEGEVVMNEDGTMGSMGDES